jgi:hypothetical protein
MDGGQRRPAEADGDEHQRDLEDGGEDQRRLDVGLHQTAQPGVNRRQGASDDQPEHDVRHQQEQRLKAEQQIDAGMDHHRAVENGRGRRRPFQRLGDPGGKRQLPTWRAPRDKAKRQNPHFQRPNSMPTPEPGAVGQAAALPPGRHPEGKEQPGIADPVADEGKRALPGRGAAETRSEKGSQTAQFPADEEQQTIGCQENQLYSPRKRPSTMKTLKTRPRCR